MRSRYDRLVPGRTALGAASFFRRIITSAEARCQVNRGINATISTKMKELLRFIPFFVAFYCLFFLGGHNSVGFEPHFIVIVRFLSGCRIKHINILENRYAVFVIQHFQVFDTNVLNFFFRSCRSFRYINMRLLNRRRLNSMIVSVRSVKKNVPAMGHPGPALRQSVQWKHAKSDA